PDRTAGRMRLMAFPFGQLTKSPRRVKKSDSGDQDTTPAGTRRRRTKASAPEDRGRWRDLTGPRPRGLRRSRLLERFGWYELDDEPSLWSTRQTIPTMPAIVGAAPPAFLGRPLGMDNQSGQLVASDPFE